MGWKEDISFINISDDLGYIVYGMFLDPQGCNGRVMHGCSDICSFTDLVACFDKGQLVPRCSSLRKTFGQIPRRFLMTIAGQKSRFWALSS
jgi:hypothetical protein